MKRNAANPVKIGAFVVIGIAVLVGAILLIGSGRFFKHTHPFISYFDGSVDGLRAGAAVKFKGVEIGRVDRVRIRFGIARTDQPIAVFFSLDDAQINDDGGKYDDWAVLIEDAIKNGLRAQLESDSVLTGVQHVSLLFKPDATPVFHDRIDGVMEMPTIPPPLQEVGAAIRSLVDRLGRYDFETLFESLRKALDGVGELTRAPEIKSTFASVDQTLKEVREAVSKIAQRVDPLAARLEAAANRADLVGTDIQAGISTARETLDSVHALSDKVSMTLPGMVSSLKVASEKLQAMSEQLEATFARTRVLLDPQAPIAVELRAGLRELAETARATRAVFELLERNPAALVRGRGESEDPPR